MKSAKEEFLENITSSLPVENVTEDGLVTKQIITPGEGDLPQKGQEATILFLSKDEAGKELDTRPNRDNPYKFRVGEEKIVSALD
jgi:FKBP-type peptidyl-prolyl cis-trans isomerase